MCFPKGMCTDMSGVLLGINPANMSKVWAHNSAISSSNTHNTENNEGNSKNHDGHGKNNEGNSKNNDRKPRGIQEVTMVMVI